MFDRVLNTPLKSLLQIAKTLQNTVNEERPFVAFNQIQPWNTLKNWH